MNDEIKQYFAKMGSKGGKSGTGKAKARSREQAQAAALSRWSKDKNSKKE